MKVFYLYVSARCEMEKLYERKKCPDTLFYGLQYLRHKGNQVNYSDRAFSEGNYWRWVFFPLSQILIKLTGYGFKLDQAIISLKEINNSDVIIACSSSVALPVALLKFVGLVKKPLVCIHTGGAEKITNPWVLASYKKLYCRFDRIVVFSRAEKALLINKLHLTDDRVLFFPLGIDTNFFIPAQEKTSDYFLSVGRDLNRDFNYLFQAFKGLPINLKVVTSKRNVSGLNPPSNVEVLFDLPYEMLRETYIKCQAVVLAIKPTKRATGQLVFLEALAMGKAVLATKTDGLINGYADLENTAILTDYNNRKAFQKNILKLNSDKNLREKLGRLGRQIVVKNYNNGIFGKNLAEMIKNLS